MTDSPRTAKEIFLQGIEITDPAARAAFLDEACTGDAPLRQRVDELLRAHDGSGVSLEPPADGLFPTILNAAIPERPGTIIGPYRLMEQIGKGGFGLVFVAEQQHPVRRKVALKVIKPGMDTHDVIARFEAERQALAMMDHPNIARVFDAGTTDSGRPYFVMELVRGIPITDYCDQSQLTPRERLELFIPVCHAVQHAHQKGIIHRDIKPSNVLVTLHDGKPVVKVIDFGVAKALNQALTDRTIYTRFAQMIGTPLYMSPEQAEMSGLDIDTRTDIYSLGVLLYELLTGSTPFDRTRFETAAFDELRRIIREEEPLKPSLRLSRSTDSLPSIAAQRKTEPARLSKIFSGDLDWITMKALEKDRTRRYETANAFAADVSRYLNDEPVEASPPTARYLLTKFAKKHRAPVITVAAMMLVLLLGIAGTTWGLFRAKIAEQAAKQTNENLEAYASTLQQGFEKYYAEVAAAPVEDASEGRSQLHLAPGYHLDVTIENGKMETKSSWDPAEDINVSRIVIAEQMGKMLLNSWHMYREELAKAEHQRDLAERHLANGLLRPIGFSNEHMDPAELRSFVDWSAIQESPLKLRVLEIALDDPEMALRVARRAEPAIQACVGLSPDRRAEAIELTSKKQRNTAADPRIRIAACWLAVGLSSSDLPALAESVTYCSDPKNDCREHFDAFVAFAASSTIPRQLTQLNLDPLIGILTDQSGDDTIDAACDLLVALEPHLQPMQVARVETALVAILQRSKNDRQIITRIKRLITLAPRLEPAQVANTCATLIACFENSTNRGVLETAAKGLEALAPRLEPAQAARAWEAFIAGALKNPMFYPDLRAAGNRLAALALRLEPAQVASSENALIDILQHSKARGALDAASIGLVALAPRLNPGQVKQAWDSLTATLETWEVSDDMFWADYAFPALAPMLEPAHVASTGATFIAAMERSSHGNNPMIANEALAALASQLDPAQAMRAWNAFSAGLQKSTFGEGVEDGADEAFVALARRLRPAQVMHSWEALIATLEKSSDYSDYNALITTADKAFAALVPRLDEAQVALAWDAVMGMLGKWTNNSTVDANPIAVEGAGEAFAALAPRLQPAQITRAWNALTAIREKSKKSKERIDNRIAINGLAALAPRLEPAQIARDWDVIIAILVEAESVHVHVAPDAVAKLALRLEPGQVIRTWDNLIAILGKSKDDELLKAAGNALVVLTNRLESAQVAPACDALIATLKRSTAGNVLEPASHVFVALVPRLEAVSRDGDSTTATTILLDCHSSLPEYPLLPGTMLPFISSPRSLAKLLSHPGCVAEQRQLLLMRFEELVLHDGQPVFLKPQTADGRQPPVDPTTPRRFHSLHDAAAWIQQNWPDFDLETNRPATWRGPR